MKALMFAAMLWTARPEPAPLPEWADTRKGWVRKQLLAGLADV